MSKWAIRFDNRQNYYRRMTAIGPQFGGTRKTATTFATKREAEAQILAFPIVASVMCSAVKVSP